MTTNNDTSVAMATSMTSYMAYAAIYYNSSYSTMVALPRIATTNEYSIGDVAVTTLSSDVWYGGLQAPAPPLWRTVLLGLLAAGTSLVTIGGNLIVILSFVLERTIRQPSNYFIASLAVSDLLIGTILHVGIPHIIHLLRTRE